MSKIDELIQEYCPEGVVFKELGEILGKVDGSNRKIVKSKIQVDGEYPVYTQGANQNPDGYSNDKDAVITDVPLILYGDHTNALKWIDDDFIAGADGVKLVKSSLNSGLDDRFLYHCLSDKIKKIPNGYARHFAQLRKLIIPIPPLEVQKEIVNILDKFTQLEAELSAELSAELEARRKQYEYYREYLFSNGDRNVQKKRLTELTKKIYSGGTPKTGNAEYWDNGTIPWMSSGEVNLGTIYATEKFITETGLKNSSAKWVPENSVVIALAGQGKTRGTVARTRIELTTNQSLASLVFDDKVINPDYVFHFLRSQYQELRRISSGDGTRGGLNLKMIGNFDVPVRPLAEQDRIVSILDRFELLINDITLGLPAEIKARRQQYEYYRTKLLTFQELSA